MTSEVVVLNQHAMVLAADSATTVTHWVNGEKETRYFKGANKLFQLSNHQPVGLMIYGSAALHNVPWEIIVKDFRSSIGRNSCDYLHDYADKFFDYIKRHSLLFPEEMKRTIFKESVINICKLHIRMIQNDHETDLKSASTIQDFQKIFKQGLASLRATIHNFDIPGEIEIKDIETAVHNFNGEVKLEIEEYLKASQLQNIIDPDELIEISIRSSIINFEHLAPDTGIVIGGYGALEYFPKFEEFSCFGFIAEKLIIRKKTSVEISSSNPANITPFATTSMINTFRLGIGPDLTDSIKSSTEKTLKSFSSDIQLAVGFTGDIPNLQDLITKHAAEHQDDWFDAAFANHYVPLARVVGSLPVGDMAGLAKTLIELQSLKERVTRPSESVSGPIEVAVITKHDGFVWVDRKHYFKPELNPRFFQRQSSETGGQ